MSRGATSGKKSTHLTVVTTVGSDSVLSKEQETALRKLFAMFDKDEDGKLSAREAVDTIRAAGLTPTEQEAYSMMEEIDTGGGSLQWEELVKYVIRYQPIKDPESTLREAFYMWDKDQSGFMYAADLKNAMLTLGEVLADDEVDEMIKEAHPASDGKINYEELMIKLLREYK